MIYFYNIYFIYLEKDKVNSLAVSLATFPTSGIMWLKKQYLNLCKTFPVPLSFLEGVWCLTQAMVAMLFWQLYPYGDAPVRSYVREVEITALDTYRQECNPFLFLPQNIHVLRLHCIFWEGFLEKFLVGISRERRTTFNTVESTQSLFISI